MMTINDFPIQTYITVQWGDMDAFRHVNNVTYVKWGETARIEYFKSIDFFNSAPEEMEFAPILGFQSVKYIAPVVYPDIIKIGTITEEIKEDRFIMKSYFFSDTQNKLVAIQTHEIIVFDYKNHQKIPVPNALKELIKKIEE